MELSDYLKLVRRRWVSILLVTLLCGALALAYTALQTKQYASDVRLFVSTTVADASNAGTINAGGQFSQARVQSYAGLASSRELAEAVIQKLDLDAEPEELTGKVTASVAVNTVNLTLTVTDADPHQAQRIAQAYAEALTELVRQLETPPGQTDAPIKATIVDNASLSENPVAPKPVRNVGLGIVLGGLLGLGLAVLRQKLDTRVHSTEEVVELTDKPVLGAIGFDAEAKDALLISDIPSHSPRAEAFRVLRTNLQFVDVDNHNKVFVLSSAVPGEGKTTTSVNLAISLAQAGIKTLLIEADLRRPRAAIRLGLDGAVGVTTVLVGKVKFEDALQHDERTGLDFLAAGPVPPNPAELLQSNAMRELLLRLRDSYEVVLIDAPPLLPVTDAALLARQADGAMLVIKHGKITRDQVKLSVDRLTHVDARLVGVVMNMVPAKRGSSYGYGYGYAPDDALTSPE
ncbi:MAG TPA: polysaccharide biosynthesis tyrosine autokinase [Nocardioides sp.]|uniref:polysaccharide biosynthesis tyrosine autokinase n=1 Tax=Nocardioides sp. TaxID=35761 RepID=UPI002ED9600B